MTDVRHVPPAIGRRLVLFLGSTIGNLDPVPRRGLLAQVREPLVPADRLLLGVDLVKDESVLEAAYNDAEGVTAEFNRNMLRVVNRAVNGDFEPQAFLHRAFYDPRYCRIEMHLVPESAQDVNLRDLPLQVHISPGETIWTESSYKFTHDATQAMLKGAGLKLERWYTQTSSRSSAWRWQVLGRQRPDSRRPLLPEAHPLAGSLISARAFLARAGRWSALASCCSRWTIRAGLAVRSIASP